MKRSWLPKLTAHPRCVYYCHASYLYVCCRGYHAGMETLLAHSVSPFSRTCLPLLRQQLLLNNYCIRFRSSKIFAGTAIETRPIASAISIVITLNTRGILKRPTLLMTPRRKQVKSIFTILIRESCSIPLPRDAVSTTFSRKAGPTAGLVSEVRELRSIEIFSCSTVWLRRNDWDGCMYIYISCCERVT
jgi:hypothetical protein